MLLPAMPAAAGAFGRRLLPRAKASAAAGLKGSGSRLLCRIDSRDRTAWWTTAGQRCLQKLVAEVLARVASAQVGHTAHDRQMVGVHAASTHQTLRVRKPIPLSAATSSDTNWALLPFLADAQHSSW